MVQALGSHELPLHEEVVQRARAWIGTPYIHQASCRGAGSDCLGLIRGLWRELYGEEPEPLPPYSPDWAEFEGSERLLEAAQRNLAGIELLHAQPGDILAFRMVAGAPARHVGVLAVGDPGRRTVVHAYSGYGVVESPLTPAWERRVVAAFRFNRRM